MTLPVLYEKKGDIAVVTLDRPSALNALTPEMLCRLADAVIDFGSDDELRVAIVTGSGAKAFCSGGDLGTLIPLLSGDREPADDWDSRLLNDPQVMAASALRDYPLFKPVIAAINGVCMAAGMELVLGTDIRVAAEHAMFALPEVKRAVVPFAGSMVRLPRQISHCHAMELLLTGEPINARDAYRMGLINYVLPAAEVMAKAEALARVIAGNGPVAVHQVKKTVTGACGLASEEGYRLEDQARRIVLATEDAKEGPRAFVQKRQAQYRGR